MGDSYKNGYNNDLSLLSDYVFELVRCTGLDSDYQIELEPEELELFQTALDALDKISERVCLTEEQIKEYQFEMAEMNREYYASRGIK